MYPDVQVFDLDQTALILKIPVRMAELPSKQTEFMFPATPCDPESPCPHSLKRTLKTNKESDKFFFVLIFKKDYLCISLKVSGA